MRSEATAAAEFKVSLLLSYGFSCVSSYLSISKYKIYFQGKIIMNDPFAMRPFFGYNFGHYLKHWLSMEEVPNAKLPSIFHVNWFRKGIDGKFLWPGYGENSRVLDWILRRIDGEDIATNSAIGFIPKLNSINLEGIKENIDMEELFRIPKDFWQKEAADLKEYLDSQVGDDLPKPIISELENLSKNVAEI